MEVNELINKAINEICNDIYNCCEHTDTKEVVERSKKIYNIYWNDERFDNIKYDLDWAIFEAEIANEKQGFVLGFKKAVEMFEEVFSLILNLNLTNYTINSDKEIISGQGYTYKDCEFKIMWSFIKIYIIGYGQGLKKSKK